MEDRVRAGLMAAEMRRFAYVTSGGFLALFFALPLALKHHLHLWPVGLALVLLALAYGAPAALKPVQQGWMALGHALGYVNSRIILTVVFFAIFFPIALLRRARKRGTILRAIGFDAGLASYRVPAQTRPREQVEKPF